MKSIAANASSNLWFVKAVAVSFCFVSFHWYKLTGKSKYADSWENPESDTWEEIYALLDSAF